MKLSLRLVHTWKICQHNLFIYVAWSEANVPSKTLSTNFVRRQQPGERWGRLERKRERADEKGKNQRKVLLAPALSLHFTFEWINAWNVHNKWVTDAKNKRNMKPSENVTMHHRSHTRLLCARLPLPPLHWKSVSNTLFMFFESINNRVQFHNESTNCCLKCSCCFGQNFDVCHLCVCHLIRSPRFGLRCNNKLQWHRCRCVRYMLCVCYHRSCCTASDLFNFSILNCNNLWTNKVVMNCVRFLTCTGVLCVCVWSLVQCAKN